MEKLLLIFQFKLKPQSFAGFVGQNMWDTSLLGCQSDNPAVLGRKDQKSRREKNFEAMQINLI